MSDIFELELRDTPTGVGITREDIRRLADAMHTTETMVVHMAISRMKTEVFRERASEEPPSDEEIARREKIASEMGEVISVRRLYDLLDSELNSNGADRG